MRLSRNTLMTKEKKVARPTELAESAHDKD